MGGASVAVRGEVVRVNQLVDSITQSISPSYGAAHASSIHPPCFSALALASIRASIACRIYSLSRTDLLLFFRVVRTVESNLFRPF
jgi:hypothetical protein